MCLLHQQNYSNPDLRSFTPTEPHFPTRTKPRVLRLSMAATAISLRHVRSNRQRFLHNPNTSFHLFSTSSSPENPDPDSDHTPSSNPQQQQQQRSSFASYFSDIKSSLKQSPPSPPPSPSPRQRYSPPQRPAQSVDSFGSIQEIRKNLSEFRLRSNPPPSPPHPPRPSSTGSTLSLQELYERNVSQRGGGGAAAGKPIADKIRESLRNIGNNAAVQQQPIKKIQMPERFMESLNNLQASNLNKDKQTKEVSEDNKREFLRRSYGFDELGQILRQLRPEVKGKKNWFSLEELNGRLKRLSEIEENQAVLDIPGLPISHLRDSLAVLSEKEAEAGKAKQNRFLAHSLLGQSSLTPSFMLSPPKDELVEKYFHPDHMSSAEKLKLELKKVRDEFKMSESDCGSARVQVAQLTTKIKHLSTVLHKKDKHSRKGLQEMVQQRKKLLKYLRRTDWDSYCLVLSKLGLRDNPDYKHA